MPPPDYAAIAKQYGATSSSAPGVDYTAIAKQFGATDSQPAGGQAQQPEQPGFFSRLAQSVGIPTSTEEWKQFGKQQLQNEGDPFGAVLRMGGNYLRNTAQGFKQGYQEAGEADEDLKAGRISRGQAIGKTGAAAVQSVINAVPVLGPTINTMAEDATRGNWAGFAGGGTGVAGQILGPKLAGKALPSFLRPAAERMYQSSLKPSLAASAPDPAALVKTGLDAGIPVSPGGAAKLSGLIDNLNKQIQGRIQAGSQAGATVDPQAVATRADQLKARFANQVNPSADLNAIEAAKQEFLANNPNPLSASDAQAMKQGTYQQLGNRAYGELSTATTEAQKALARGLKEELQTQFPEIKGLNAQEGKLIDLDGAIQKAVNRIGNHQLMGIGTPIVAGAVGGTAGGPAGIVAGLLKAVIDDPVVKSKMAIALSKSQGIPPFLAASRIALYSNSLGQTTQGR